MTYTITFTIDQLQILNAALIKLPYEQVAELIHDISKQLNQYQEPVTKEDSVDDKNT